MNIEIVRRAIFTGTDDILTLSFSDGRTSYKLERFGRESQTCPICFNEQKAVNQLVEALIEARPDDCAKWLIELLIEVGQDPIQSSSALKIYLNSDNCWNEIKAFLDSRQLATV